MNPEASVTYHVLGDGEQPTERGQQLITEWIIAMVANHGYRVGELTYVFVDDEELHRMNVRFLDHDTLTDIITFPYEAEPDVVTGDCFISTERVADNARDLGITYRDELHRVMIHGALHLCGFGDKTAEEAKRMRELEERALGARPEGLVAG